MKHFRLWVLAAVLASTPLIAAAAAPDGAGPWADSFSAVVQGLRKNGTPVDANRSDGTFALGAAESTGTQFDATPVGTFFSLGFGGTITLGFTNAIANGTGSDVKIYEVTNGSSYPEEKVRVEASHNGTDWTLLSSSITRDAELDLGILPCALYIRLTDVSDPSLFQFDGDGYDLDAAKALNNGTTCDASSSVTIDKSADKTEVLQGESVTYTYVIANDGDFALSDVVVTDDTCVSPTYQSGDAGTAGVLDVGESWTYTCSMPLDEKTTNIAVVTALDPWQHSVTASDTVTVAVKALGCTLTQGYWKNHADPLKHYDTSWNGADPMWLTYLQTPVKGNAWYILAHQYIAAMLNAKTAYVPAAVQDAIDAAATLLGSTPSAPSKTDKPLFTSLATILAGYNEGLTIVPHCSEI